VGPFFSSVTLRQHRTHGQDHVILKRQTLLTIWPAGSLSQSKGLVDYPEHGVRQRKAMDFQIKTIGKQCAATGETLVPGSICYSSVVEQNGQLLRHDYSEAGWTGPPEGSVAFWKCIIPKSSENKPKPLDTEALMRYFEQLCEDANPAQEKFAYILSLLLLQKKRLKIEGSRQDGATEYLELIGTGGEGPFEVRDQQLSETEIEQLQQGLNARLAADWC